MLNTSFFRAGWGFALVLALALGVGRPPTAVAQGSDEEARAIFQAGQVAYQEGRFEAALEYFQRAYEISERALLLFNVARTAEQLRRDQLAIDTYRRFLAGAPEDVPQRQLAENRLQALLQLQGDRRPSSDPDSAEDVRAVAAPASATTDASAGGGGPGALPWVLVGGSAAVAITGVVLLAVAAGDISTVENVAAGTFFEEVEGNYDRIGPLSAAGGILLGVGLAGAAAGVVWAIVGGGGGDEDAASASVGLRVGPSSLHVQGTF